MKRVLLLACIVTLTSCMTVKRIEQNCDKFAKICVAEKVKETIYRDTTIFRSDTVLVPLPADSVKITDTIRVVKNIAYLPTVRKKAGIIGVDAGVNNSIIRINAYLTDSTILYKHQDTIFIRNAIREEKVSSTVPVKFIPSFYRFTFWVFIFEIVALIVFFSVKYLLVKKLINLKILRK